MTSLVPTPRTDKNGRTQIRHVRADAAPPVQRGSIPSPAAPAAPVFPEGSDEHIITLVGHEEALTYRHHPDWVALRLLRQNDGTVLPLAAKLMTTGHPEARAAARATTCQLLEDVADAYNEGEDDPSWRDIAHASWAPLGGNQLACSWAAGSVYGETGRRISESEYGWASDVRAIVRYEGQIFGTGYTSKAHESYTGHWRGTTALWLIDETRRRGDYVTTSEPGSPEAKREIQRFVDWAGKHRNIALVIEAAAARNTIDVETLEAIIENMQAGSIALREGVL